MGMFLNSKIPFDLYKSTASEKYFVDKIALLAELIPAIGKNQRFFCITRPRRFGKSIMANMIGAFFEKTADAGELFSGLAIASPGVSRKLENSGCGNYRDHLNRYNVIYMDLSGVPENCTSYEAYISRIIHGLKNDLLDAFPETGIDTAWPLWDALTVIYQKTGQRFIFILDEWDALFHMTFIGEPEKKAYLLFLKSLLKDRIYAELVYMTGILPIAKYFADGQPASELLDQFRLLRFCFQLYQA